MGLTSIRLLVIEDRPDDAELIIDQFQCAGYTVHSKRVATAETLREVLNEPWDLIISDHAMPSFSSRGALKIVKETRRDVPFILVSGSIGEREAVEMMRLGVSDYILKDNLDRLVVSAERELREAENRRKGREAAEELRQSEQRLREMYVQADKLNRLKDEFLATLSHELRTPLNIIMGNADILMENAENSGDEETKQLADAIYRNSIIQTQLVNDLLDVSSIVTGKIRFEPSMISLVELIEQVVSSLSATAHAKKIVLSTDMKDITSRVSADKNRLQQILWNLLSNALKFTGENGAIQLNAFKRGQSLVLEVIDNGIGIDPGFLPGIFERFQQEDSSTTRRYGGLGLGLSIVRNLVELHGGTVQAKSAGKGQGATFTVAIPYDENGESALQNIVREDLSAHVPKRVVENEGLKQLNGLKVLLIEDSDDTRLLVKIILTRAGVEVRDAGSAEAARTILLTFVPHIIVSDIGMPLENGIEFIKKLRSKASATLRSIPAIALTAFAREEEKRATLSAGFQIHVVKPVSSSTLLDAIRSLL